MLARYMDRTYEAYSNFSTNTHTIGRKQKEKDNFKSKLRELIKHDQLEEAFENMNSYIALNPELNEKNDLIMIINRFTRNQKEKRIGGTAPEIIKRENIIITADFLEILNAL